MNKNISPKDVDAVLTNSVAEFIDPDGAFRTKLQKKVAGEAVGDIIIKFGADPSRPDIHLGHAVVLKKMRALQDLGCKVVFLVGDYTAHIGDPTGKSKVRAEVEQKEIETNMATYVEQVGKILNTDPAVFSWIRNSDWFYGITDLMFDPGSKISMDFVEGGVTKHMPLEPNSFVGKALLYENTRMQKTHLKREATVSITMKSLLWTLKHISHARLIARDMFQVRLKAGEELFMHEMLYPVLQGIDSSVIAMIYGSCDMEIGGTDQTFNNLMGRDVMKINKQKEQAVMTMPLLVGTDGREKMSKSLDNYIAITDTPANMYGKVMSIPDNCIESYFELCTYSPVEEIKKNKGNPKDLKMRLAREIVAIYHGSDAAAASEKDFVNTFSKGLAPEHVPEIKVSKGSALLEAVVGSGLVSSKTEFRRLISEGAVRYVEGGEKISDPLFALEKSATFRIGASRFLKVIVE